MVRQSQQYSWQKGSNTKAARQLSRLAKALGLPPKSGWKTQLAEKYFKVNQNVISQWAKRDSIPKEALQVIMDLSEQYHLDNIFLDEGEASENSSFQVPDSVFQRWPVIKKLLTEIIEASRRDDTKLVVRMLQYALDIIREDISWPYEKEAEQFPEYSEERAGFIYQMAAKDQGLENFFFFNQNVLVHASPPGWDDYLQQKISDAELYGIAEDQIVHIKKPTT